MSKKPTIFYRCPDDNFEFSSTKNHMRCLGCGSLNLERYLGSNRWVKADAADVPANASLVHYGKPPGASKRIDVIVPIKVNVSYTVSVFEVSPAAIRKALLNKNPSDWSKEPSLYEFLGIAFRDVVSKMSDEEILDAVSPDSVSETHGKK